MKKKIISVVLALVMAFSVSCTALAAGFSVPDFDEFVAAVRTDYDARYASAGNLARRSIRLMQNLTRRIAQKTVAADDIAGVIDTASALLANVYDHFGDAITISADALNASLSATQATVGTGDVYEDSEIPADRELSLISLSEIFRKYVFVRLENADALAKLIAASAVYDYTVYDGENGTVIIRIDIGKNPELFNQAVFCKLVEYLYEEQGKEMLRNNDGSVNYLMSYEHIAGELALHALVYAAANEIIRVTGSSNSTLFNLYHSSLIADLNIDEARLPTQFIEFIGAVILNSFRYNIFRLLGLI